MIESGKLRQRIEIQTQASGNTELGGRNGAWSTTATRYGSIEPLSGREYLLAKQVAADVSHKITLRYYPLTPTMRLKFDSRIFQVVSVLNIRERKQATVAMCVERL